MTFNETMRDKLLQAGFESFAESATPPRKVLKQSSHGPPVVARQEPAADTVVAGAAANKKPLIFHSSNRVKVIGINSHHGHIGVLEVFESYGGKPWWGWRVKLDMGGFCHAPEDELQMFYGRRRE